MDEEDFEAFVVFAGIGEEFCMDEEELLLLEGLLGQNSAHDMSVEELLSLEQQMRDDDDEDDAVWYFSDSNSDNEEHDNTEIISEEENNISTKKPNLPNNLRRQLVLDLFSAASAELVLPRGMVTHVVLQYAISRFTVNRIWGEAKRQKLAGLEVNVSSKKTNSGRKPLITDEEALRAVPLKQRTTMRSFATALEVSPSTIYRLLKKGILRSHTNSIKPKLTPKHKTDRLKFILSHIIPPTVTSKPRFDCLYNMVHIDEKWFFMSRITQRFYLLSDEEDPYRACQSKNFITKVMFEAAIARPIITPNGEVIWDGKIGIFPFVDYIPAQRNSSNRPAGTIETKAKQSITKETIRELIINVLLPAIRAKWPDFGCKTIWIQQDNARPHIRPDDMQFLEAAKQDGFDMHLICQPAQSPDLNCLDLGFFRAIQSIQHQYFPDTVDKLIESVVDAYNCYDSRIINYTWLHLMYVMVEIMKVKGGNNYKNPHKGKKRMDRLGQLPTSVEVLEPLINDTVNYLNENIVSGADPMWEGMELGPEI